MAMLSHASKEMRGAGEVVAADAGQVNTTASPRTAVSGYNGSRVETFWPRRDASAPRPMTASSWR
jgi:hypothetical protein